MFVGILGYGTFYPHLNSELPSFYHKRMFSDQAEKNPHLVSNKGDASASSDPRLGPTCPGMSSYRMIQEEHRFHINILGYHGKALINLDKGVGKGVGYY